MILIDFVLYSLLVLVVTQGYIDEHTNNNLNRFNDKHEKKQKKKIKIKIVQNYSTICYLNKKGKHKSLSASPFIFMHVITEKQKKNRSHIMILRSARNRKQQHPK